jgi:ligand-binding SRPBCC domain-containing protein
LQSTVQHYSAHNARVASTEKPDGYSLVTRGRPSEDSDHDNGGIVISEIVTELPSQIPQVARSSSGGYQLSISTVVSRSLEETFLFFADAHNLDSITPPWLQFRIVTHDPIVIRQGTLIDYSLRLHRFPMAWRSCIEEWSPNHKFTDVQVRGPYKSWRHEHFFKDIGEGKTRVEDRVSYQVPGGSLIHRAFVRRDLLRIFIYRQEQIRRLLG